MVNKINTTTHSFWVCIKFVLHFQNKKIVPFLKTPAVKYMRAGDAKHR